MTQQLRMNTGKPKLTYFWSNELSLFRLTQAFEADLRGGIDYHDGNLSEAVACITDYLSRGDERGLEDAILCLVPVLQEQCGGDAIMNAGSTVSWLMRNDAAIDAFCRVCVYGENKYARGNYRKGAPISQYFDCALRHIRAHFAACEPADEMDSESGESHLAHAFWNLWQALDQPAFRDDRMDKVFEGAYGKDDSFDIEILRAIDDSSPPAEEDLCGYGALEEETTGERPCVPPPAFDDSIPPPRDSDAPECALLGRDCRYCFPENF